MSTALLADLRRRGVEVRPDGERLRWRAPRGVMRPTDLAALAREKPALLAALAREAKAAESLALFERRGVRVFRHGPGLSSEPPPVALPEDLFALLVEHFEALRDALGAPAAKPGAPS